MSLLILQVRWRASAEAGKGVSLYREFGYMKPFAVLLGVPQVILSLLIEPTLCRGVERHGQADGHLGTDARAAIQNGGKGLAADPQRLGCLRDIHAERFQAQGLDDRSRVGWIVHAHRDDLSSGSPRNQRHQRPCRQIET